MATFDKMIIIPKSLSNETEYICEIALQLANISAYNKDLDMKVGNIYKKGVKINEYINTIFQNGSKLEYQQEFASLLDKANIDKSKIRNRELLKLLSPNLYTKISPIHKRMSSQWHNIE